MSSVPIINGASLIVRRSGSAFLQNFESPGCISPAAASIASPRALAPSHYDADQPDAFCIAFTSRSISSFRRTPAETLDSGARRRAPRDRQRQSDQLTSRPRAESGTVQTSSHRYSIITQAAADSARSACHRDASTYRSGPRDSPPPDRPGMPRQKSWRETRGRRASKTRHPRRPIRRRY